MLLVVFESLLFILNFAIFQGWRHGWTPKIGEWSDWNVFGKKQTGSSSSRDETMVDLEQQQLQQPDTPRSPNKEEPAAAAEHLLAVAFAAEQLLVQETERADAIFLAAQDNTGEKRKEEAQLCEQLGKKMRVCLCGVCKACRARQEDACQVAVPDDEP